MLGIPRKSARPVEKRAKLENETRMTNIDALDNYIMVKVFKYLDYCDLAKSSRVSKRFRDIIRANRKSLARLYVDRIQVTFEPGRHSTFAVQTFNQKLSYHAYNEWVLRNQCSNQSQFDVQVAENQNVKYGVETNYLLVYSLIAEVNYKYPNNGDTTTVFDARVPLVLSHKNLLLNLHFIRLIADPNIYINHLQLCLQNDVLSLLSQAIGNQNRNRLRCEKLTVILNGNTQNIINWVNNHVCCNELNIGRDYSTPDKPWKYYDKLILDLCLNGAHITSALNFSSYDFSNVVVNFVQKFIDLKEADQYQVVQSIRSCVKKLMLPGVEPEILKVLESNCATLPRKVIVPKIDNFLEGLRKERRTELEFINNNILKKLQITFTIFGDEYLPANHLPNLMKMRELCFSLIITDL
ncbi:hypothetical protein Ddc_10772 [Ditylenchus destructor]|nr:hypothetical protein Ddc_10772 [Ditylenchus destructor]